MQSAEITDKGLYIVARISDTREDIKTLIREKCLRTFSIGYNELDADYDEDTKTKYVKEVELLEISIVTVPANTEAMFTESTPKSEDGKDEEEKSDDDKEEDEEKSAPATAADLLKFIVDVKSAVGFELNEKQVLGVCEYFNLKENSKMDRKELLELLRKKTASKSPAAKEAPGEKEENAPSESEGGGEQEMNASEMMQMVAAKLDAIATGLAQLLEESGKTESEEDEESKEEDKPKEDEESKEEDKGEEEDKKEEESKEEESKEEDKGEEEEKQEDEDKKEEDDEEKALDSEITALDAEIAAIEDAENI